MSITTAETFDARVKKGVEKLNAAKGADWVSLIDPSALDLMSSSKCVLGQLYGDYHDGLVKLGLSSGNNDAEDYGFTTLEGNDPSNAKITAAWLRFLSFKDGQIMEHDSWNATWSFLRIEKMVRVGDKTWYVVQPGDMDSDTEEFRADAYEIPRLYSAANIVRNYKRKVDLPKKGQIVKGKGGEIFYVSKDSTAWRIDDAVATWQSVSTVAELYGPLVPLKTSSGKEFNTETF